MVFKYMVADTDLVNGQVTEPKTPPAHTPKTPIPTKKKSPSSLKTKAKFCLLLLANLLVLAFLYHRFAPESFPRPWDNISLPGTSVPSMDFLTSTKVTITGIMYYDENPAAIISGKIVHEGDIIEGCKVVKIHRNKVEFQKNGRRFTKTISK